LRPPSTSTNVTIFLVFFGASLLDAIVTRNWPRAGFWLLIALVFLAAPSVGRRLSRKSGPRVP
jgi:hypothetical protein